MTDNRPIPGIKTYEDGIKEAIAIVRRYADHCPDDNEIDRLGRAITFDVTHHLLQETADLRHFKQVRIDAPEGEWVHADFYDLAMRMIEELRIENARLNFKVSAMSEQKAKGNDQ